MELGVPAARKTHTHDYLEIDDAIYAKHGLAFFDAELGLQQTVILVALALVLADITPDQEKAKKPRDQDKPPTCQRNLRGMLRLDLEILTASSYSCSRVQRPTARYCPKWKALSCLQGIYITFGIKWSRLWRSKMNLGWWFFLVLRKNHSASRDLGRDFER